MTFDADPLKTHAVVVGIERYAAGSNWNLNGPAVDAALFVAWLRDKGVPAENIGAFISALDDNAGSIRHCADRDVAVREPTLDNIRRVFAETLPNCAGDLLLVFWGGHGVVTDTLERRLFFGDASIADKRNLEFDSLLKAARTESYAGFAQQAMIVDACANFFEEMGAVAGLAGEKIPLHITPLRHVRQLVLYASDTGEVATNNNLRRTGAFSEQVRAALTTFPPDLEAVHEAVTAHFAALRRSGASRQTPVQYRCDLGSRQTDSGSIPVAGALRRAAAQWNISTEQIRRMIGALARCPSLASRASRDDLVSALTPSTRADVPARDDDATTDLRHILSAVLAEPGRLQQFFDALEGVEPETLEVLAARETAERVLLAASARFALRNAAVPSSAFTGLFMKSLPDPQSVAFTTDLDRQLETLAELAPRIGSVTPLVEFMERVYAQSARVELDDWIAERATAQQRADVRVRLDAERASETAAKAYLSVMIRTVRLAPGETPEVEAWLWAGDSTEVTHWLRPCEATIGSVQAIFQSILREARGSAAHDLTVEFVVPREQFGMTPDQWEIEADDFNPASILGCDHPVILRWRERVREPDKARRGFWVARTKRIRERLEAGVAASYLWVEPSTHDRVRLEKDLKGDNAGEYIGLLFVPPESPSDLRLDLVIGALVAGAPIICWTREAPADWSVMKDEIAALTVGPLHLLPHRVQQFRATTANSARCFTVICDDPDHLPQPKKATPPGQRGQ